MAIVFRFIFGTAVGSFINVLSARYEPGRRIFDFGIIGGRSRCPNCGKTLRSYELIPILSFLIQKGRCRGCGEAISFQYPLVEIATGLVFAYLPEATLTAFSAALYRTATGLPFWYYLLTLIFLLAALALIFLSVVDYRLRIIPDQTNFFIALLGTFGTLVLAYYGLLEKGIGTFIAHYAMLFGLSGNVLLNRAAAAIFAAAFFGALIYLTRGRGMGLGDLKLGAALGLLLGWPDITLTLALAFIVGSLWSIILIIQGKKGLKSTVPFGPFIALGALSTIFFGRTIFDIYFSLF